MSNPLKERWAHARREQRRARRREEYRRGLRPMVLAAWNITKEHNVGSLVRTAHAAGVQEVVMVGDRDWNLEAAKTAELYTDIRFVDGVDEFLRYLEAGRWQLVAVELDRRSQNLFDATYPERPCFLLGAEREGIPEPLLEAAHTVVQIPQWGLIPCLNLAVAGSIVVYDHLAKLHRQGRLDRPDGGLDES